MKDERLYLCKFVIFKVTNTKLVKPKTIKKEKRRKKEDNIL